MYFYNFLLLASVLVAKDRFFAWGTINLFDDDPNTSSFDVSLIPNADDGSNVSLQNLFAGDTSDDENSLFLDMNNQQGQDSSSLNDLVLGDSSCNSNLQTPVSRRLRARSDSDISSDDFCGTSPPVYKPPMIEFKFPSAIPQDLATQKELMDFFCPTAVFRGVLNTVVCSIFRRGNEPANIMEAPKWMFDLALVTVKDAFVVSPLTYTTCSEDLYWCCFKFLSDYYPEEQDLKRWGTILGTGYWCAKSSWSTT